MSIPFDSVLSEVSDHDDVVGEEDIVNHKPDANTTESIASKVAALDGADANDGADPNGLLTGNPVLEDFAQLAPSATRYAMSIVRRWADAEEIVQEAYCRLIESDSQQSINKPRLFCVVRNLSIDRLRTQSRRKFEAVDTSQIVSSKDEANEQRLERLEQGVEEVLAEMPTDWADALRLKINGELSYEEISKVLEATHAQIRTWIFRARKQLEKDLTQRGLLEGGSEL